MKELYKYTHFKRSRPTTAWKSSKDFSADSDVCFGPQDQETSSTSNSSSAQQIFGRLAGSTGDTLLCASNANETNMQSRICKSIADPPNPRLHLQQHHLQVPWRYPGCARHFTGTDERRMYSSTTACVTSSRFRLISFKHLRPTMSIYKNWCVPRKNVHWCALSTIYLAIL